MKTLDEAKAMLRHCNTMAELRCDIEHLFGKLEQISKSDTMKFLCPGRWRCDVCMTPKVLVWVWPELLEYNEILSEHDDFGGLK